MRGAVTAAADGAGGAGAVVCEELPGETGAPGGNDGVPAGTAVVAGCVLGGTPGGRADAGVPGGADGCGVAGFDAAGVVPAGVDSGPRLHAATTHHVATLRLSTRRKACLRIAASVLPHHGRHVAEPGLSGTP